MNSISIIVIAYNEEAIIKKCLNNLKTLDGIESAEIIISDGNSDDKTRALVDDDIKIIINNRPNKSEQMNQALENSNGDILWFIHTDMFLPINSLTLIKEYIADGYDGGGFANTFDQHNRKIKRLGRIMNLRLFKTSEQSDKGIFYGDNAIFIKRKILKALGGFPSQEIMEDYELSIRLKKYGAKLKKINEAAIVVSARRHIKDGFIRTRLRWIMIRQLYKLGVSPTILKKLYIETR